MCQTLAPKWCLFMDVTIPYAAANRRMLQRLQGSARAQWHLQLENAIEWELSVVRAAALIADRYRMA